MSTDKRFSIQSPFQPSGDQPQAISKLVEGFKNKTSQQVLLGVTGSGKTFTMAHVIEKLQKPTLILAPNKTLASQLFVEFKELFPQNAVEYFVSYYDYYQPEAYIPTTDTFIEKDSSINEQIDRMRHSATRSVLHRRDVIVVSSVSCIYGLGSPEVYRDLLIFLKINESLKRDVFLKKLVDIQYSRGDQDFHRGSFRVRGDVVDIFPPYEDEKAIRVEFFGDFIEKIYQMDPLTGQISSELDQVAIYPGSHYVSDLERKKKAIASIQEELQKTLTSLKEAMKWDEAQRLEQRTFYDIEMMEELGFCSGIENYSRHFTGQQPGSAPPTLLNYFPKDFMTIIDESHVTVPQIGGMYRGDRARKLTLVEHGFRLPSALDNRPLNFQEFEELVGEVLYVSATPGDYEMQLCKNHVVEQIIRPTGLLDPLVEVRPAQNQVDDILSLIRACVKKKQRVLITTLTKKSAEDLTSYFSHLGILIRYLHSDIKTMERSDLIRDFRLGVFHVLVGINLLREGLDIPEVALVAITDADKEGFLRSQRSLIQTMGRAARNVEGRVILYANEVTDSMEKALSITTRRREIQKAYNEKTGITPQTIHKKVNRGLIDIYEGAKTPHTDHKQHLPVNSKSLDRKLKKLKKDMKKAAGHLEFEKAALYRDEIKRLEILQLDSQGDGT